MVRKLMNIEFPSTSDDFLFGDIILQCWRGHYPSIRELKQAIQTQLRSSDEMTGDEIEATMTRGFSNVPAHSDLSLLSECKTIMIQN